jgi:hypothetical protein
LKTKKQLMKPTSILCLFLLLFISAQTTIDDPEIKKMVAVETWKYRSETRFFGTRHTLSDTKAIPAV